jgi:hypothetical protein
MMTNKKQTDSERLLQESMVEEDKIRETVDKDGIRWVLPPSDPDHVENKDQLLDQLLEKWHKLHPGKTPV